MSGSLFSSFVKTAFAYLLFGLPVLVYGQSIPSKNNSTPNNTASKLKGDKVRAYRTGGEEKLSIGLYFTLSGASRVADGVNEIFNNLYSAAVDGNDAEQIPNFDEDLSIKRENKYLSIEGRPLIDDKDTIFLYIFHMKVKDYHFQFFPTTFNAPGLRAYLRDNFLNTETPISLSANTRVNFSCTSDPLTTTGERFQVLFRTTVQYQSQGNVNLSSASNWLYYNGAGYVAAINPPTVSNDLTIKAGDTLLLDQNFTVDTTKYLTLENTAALVIQPNKSLTINGTVDFNNQHVTIQSAATGTGSIGKIASPESNHLLNATNVTVERYIAATGRRALRTLSSSVNTTGSIKANWQEGASNPNQITNNNGSVGDGFGTHITGSDADALNGLDPTLNGNRSLYTYDGIYNPVTSTTANTLDGKIGYLLFVRGDRSTITRLNANSSGNTVLRATGTLLTGDVPYTLRGNNLFTLVTNPYAAPIDWSTVFSNGGAGIENFYTYVDPRVGTQGGYVTVTNTGTNSTGGTNASIQIQSGQAFFVKSGSTGTPSLTIKEAHKSTTNNVNVFRTGSQEQMGIGLYFTLDGEQRVADGVNILFNNNYSAGVDGNDAEQITNFDEDISVNRNGKYLSIEGRPLVDQFDTIFLNMTHMQQKDYTFEFNPASFSAPGLMAYLQDKFFDVETPISLSEQTIIPFAISSDAASNASDRFRVVFRNITVLPIIFTNVKAFEKGNNIQVEWNLGNEQNMKQYEVEKSTDGRTFTKAGMQTARATMSADNYQYLDQQPNIGNNYYRIKAIERGGTFKYSQVVNVKVGKGNSAITVYPNPVTDNVISLQLTNQPKGKYSIKLLNQLGQEVYRKELNHIGGSATETLQLNKKIARGLYNLQVSEGAVFKVIKVRVE